MDYKECGCSQATSIKELCPQCQAEYEEYVRIMTLLRMSVAAAEAKEVQRADAA